MRPRVTNLRLIIKILIPKHNQTMFSYINEGQNSNEVKNSNKSQKKRKFLLLKNVVNFKVLFYTFSSLELNQHFLIIGRSFQD